MPCTLLWQQLHGHDPEGGQQLVAMLQYEQRGEVTLVTAAVTSTLPAKQPNSPINPNNKWSLKGSVAALLYALASFSKH